MSKFWSPLAASLVPYVPGEQPKDKKYIKLNTNENPYPPSPNVLEAIKAAANEDLRLYPDPTCGELSSVVADYFGLKPNQVFLGNGSDEVLSFAFAAFFDPAKPVLFADITYSFYKVYAEFYGLKADLIPLDEQLRMPLALFNRENGGIVIPNPNAPTAMLIPVDEFRALLEQNADQVVIIDEAYIDFGGESAAKLVNDYPNVLVVQTLSKSRSLAGLRVGWALGSEELIDGLNRVKNSFNSYTIDRLALAGAIAAIKDEAYFQETAAKVNATRDAVAAELKSIGFHVTDSKANFVFISHPNVDAEAIFLQLREQGILVRYFKQPRIDRFLRVTIGTDEEMEAFLKAVRGIVAP
ncbi:histidinol-phosphate transaminase [Paenibacillus radicis (ex Gao et al. 2016)]|uniref:Histidinol-phosphate aminotransferase n=1 Tax=Paenibacillus radicis (ex Gao et al. 2016) TaxID=1737354 RepID=A0A917M917_9BACL|nr:histidinol-phosphate transaminase [Paenibacillus radicis (ex Gao et al. 2016)]GGG85338.1 histidinol-phosphate aminotransferase [Paenibacillus radicis (ex Gao et al. 2016)]